MFTGIIIIAAISILAVLSHRRSRLENRVYKNVPLNDWLQILVFPTVGYIGWFYLIRSILERPKLNILPWGDFDILSIMILFMMYLFVGIALHFTGKILWRYLYPKRNTMAYKVNEMFHGRLSHYLVFLNLMLIAFLVPMLEINHPVTPDLSISFMIIPVGIGIIFGVFINKAIFYTNEWFGGYNKPLFFLSSALFVLLVVIVKLLQLNLDVYPVSLFILSLLFTISGIFILRQIFIFSRLNNKRKLRFLAKILSA